MATAPVQHTPETSSAETVEQRFRRLESICEADTTVLSNPNLIINHWGISRNHRHR